MNNSKPITLFIARQKNNAFDFQVVRTFLKNSYLKLLRKQNSRLIFVLSFTKKNKKTMDYRTQSGINFDSTISTLKTGDYVLLHTDQQGKTSLDRPLSADYVENWPGSASTLETDGKHIEVVK